MPAEREDLRAYIGPTPYCNWVIKDRVMAGGYPACVDDAENDALLLALMRDLRVDTFVCLQTEMRPDVPEYVWKAGRAPRPYTHDIKRLLQTPGYAGFLPKSVDFAHLPIVDGGVTADTLVDKFVDELVGKVLDGKRLYIHCWGGHGRTGVIVAVMLGRMYDVTAGQALARTQQLHDVRGDPQDVGSPSTRAQVDQVKRLLARGGVAAVDSIASSPVVSQAQQEEEQERVRIRDRRREKNAAAIFVKKKDEAARARAYAGIGSPISSPKTPIGAVTSDEQIKQRWR